MLATVNMGCGTDDDVSASDTCSLRSGYLRCCPVPQVALGYAALGASRGVAARVAAGIGKRTNPGPFGPGFVCTSIGWSWGNSTEAVITGPKAHF